MEWACQVRWRRTRLMWNSVGRNRLNFRGSEEVGERCGQSRLALEVGEKGCVGSQWVLEGMLKGVVGLGWP
jgi:hypothetical protein